MENNFVFRIEITRKDNSYKDDISIKGTELEILGAIEKTIILLNNTKQKIINSVGRE